MLTALWQVVLADGNRDMHEDTLLRVVANLLGISDRDNARARQKAGG
ncbi:TerB family tellurite resistance protein [Klebsiella pneumoniae]